MLIDTHAHLNFPDYENVDEIINNAKAAGVEKIINIGTSLEDSELAIQQRNNFNNIYATVGIHPNDPPTPTATEGQANSVDWKKFEELAQGPKVVAIGECGLDFSRLLTTDHSLQQDEKERQKKLFLKQIEIAQELNLPLSIHVRDAYDDMGELAKTIQTPAVFHCFSGTAEYLGNLLTNPNFYFSFAGNLTFKNAENIRKLAKLVSLDKLLVETDCPFLAPEPYRGKRNEPAYIVNTASRLAEIKGVSLDELGKTTSQNAIKLFHL